MPSPENTAFSSKIVEYSFILTALFSLVALTATFLISNSSLAFEIKVTVFLIIAVIYLLICAAFYFWQKSRLSAIPDEKTATGFNREIEERLFALEEANEFFGASLKSADMFRLVASRINEIVPFAACVLYLTENERKNLSIKYALGANLTKILEFNSDINRSLASKAYLSRKGLVDEKNAIDKRVFPKEFLSKFGSAVAVPLFQGAEVFGIIVLYSDAETVYRDDSLTLCEAVASRVAPLFKSSLCFEQNLSNALTDSLTKLPNERAFFLVLENQIAESQRFRNERPLTVLTIDIQNFDEINNKYGHLRGDEILEFVAVAIKKQLRKMDVLVRSAGDEFFAILPTANEKITDEIKQRINRAFVLNQINLANNEKIHIELNYGSATFWRDGETANELLKTALLRKKQNKSDDRGNVLWFPKEFIN
jgi:diguanylate cyclase (GGDEF)-like protein